MKERSTRGWILFLWPLIAVAALAAQPSNLDRALEAQARLVSASPREAGLLIDFGNLLDLAGRTEEAEAAYREAASQAPDDVTPRYNLALLLHETGRPRAALREVQAVLKTEPDHAWAHYHAGMLFDERKKRSRAIHHYAQAISLDSRFKDPRFNPHIIENRLADSAQILAYSWTSAAALAPRSYDHPNRVAGLLLPSVRAKRPMAADDKPLQLVDEPLEAGEKQESESEQLKGALERLRKPSDPER